MSLEINHPTAHRMFPRCALTFRHSMYYYRVTETGYIKVSIEGSQDLWVYRIPNAFGEYGITSDISQALLASYTTSASDSGSPVDITILVTCQFP